MIGREMRWINGRASSPRLNPVLVIMRMKKYKMAKVQYGKITELQRDKNTRNTKKYINTKIQKRGDVGEMRWINIRAGLLNPTV